MLFTFNRRAPNLAQLKQTIFNFKENPTRLEQAYQELATKLQVTQNLEPFILEINLGNHDTCMYQLDYHVPSHRISEVLIDDLAHFQAGHLSKFKKGEKYYPLSQTLARAFGIRKPEYDVSTNALRLQTYFQNNHLVHIPSGHKNQEIPLSIYRNHLAITYRNTPSENRTAIYPLNRPFSESALATLLQHMTHQPEKWFQLIQDHSSVLLEPPLAAYDSPNHSLYDKTRAHLWGMQYLILPEPLQHLHHSLYERLDYAIRSRSINRCLKHLYDEQEAWQKVGFQILDAYLLQLHAKPNLQPSEQALLKQIKDGLVDEYLEQFSVFADPQNSQAQYLLKHQDTKISLQA